MRAQDVENAVHEPGARFARAMTASPELGPLTVAVVHPCDGPSLGGALEAARRALIVPVLVGPQRAVRATAEAAGEDLAGVEIVDVPDARAAATHAVALAREGRVQALMKGHLHTDALMKAVIDRAHGLRTERRMSQVYTLDVPHYPKLLHITDAAINIHPTLVDKLDIIRNAIDLLHAMGRETPRVALLSAMETINPAIASTLDAAALCKMADRGQIDGASLDGPLAFDNAVSRTAADIKGILSVVAGDVDILIAPDLEAGNMLAKALIYLASAEAAGLVLGARVPVVLTSRADSILSRVASCALARLVHHRSGDTSA